MVRSNVVLPAPVGPSTTSSSSACASRLTSRKRLGVAEPLRHARARSGKVPTAAAGRATGGLTPAMRSVMVTAVAPWRRRRSTSARRRGAGEAQCLFRRSPRGHRSRGPAGAARIRRPAAPVRMIRRPDVSRCTLLALPRYSSASTRARDRSVGVLVDVLAADAQRRLDRSAGCVGAGPSHRWQRQRIALLGHEHRPLRAFGNLGRR